MDLRRGDLIKDQTIWPVKSGVKLSPMFFSCPLFIRKEEGVGGMWKPHLSPVFLHVYSQPFFYFLENYCIRSNSQLFSFCYFIWKEMPARTKITQCQEANEKDNLSIIYGVFFDPSFSPVPFTLSVTMSCRPAFHISFKFTLPPSLPCLPNSPALTTSRQNITFTFWRLVATL